MKEQSTSIEFASRVCYETMEAHARGRIKGWLQDLLEAEVMELSRPRQVATPGGGCAGALGLPQWIW